jgi:hypothetical protein
MKNSVSAMLLGSLVLMLSSCTGGETVVSGFGNSGNYFGVDAEVEMLARAFSNDANVPLVSDEELQQIHNVVKEQALAGDLRSAVVIYKLAVKQRTEEDD